MVLFLQIKYTKSAVKVIGSLDKAMKLRIKEGIEGLAVRPLKEILNRCKVLTRHYIVYG